MTVMQAWSKKRVAAGVVLVTAAVVAAAVSAQNPARDRRDRTSTSYEEYLQSGPVRVSELLDVRVKALDGDAIGEVDDVVLAKSNDLVLIVSVGGLLDIGDKLIARPLDDFRIAVDGSELYLDITDQQLAAEPPYSYDPADADAQAPSAAGPRAHAGVLGERTAPLLGANVVDETGRAIGKIDDLLIPLDEDEMARAVLSIGGIIGIGARLVAVPLEDIDAVASSEDGAARSAVPPQVQLDMRAEAVALLPRFDYSELEQQTAAL